MATYPDRAEAGRLLAGHLLHHRDAEPLVLGVPRGGIVVAARVAEALGGELGAVQARKVGAPWSSELAIGAVAADGVPSIDSGMVASLRLEPTEIEEAIQRARDELRRRTATDPGGDWDAAGRTVVVVDDGVATGATLRAALGFVRRQEPALLACAVPVGPPRTVALIATEVDEVTCPIRPEWFSSVGEWYDDFTQTTDEEVRRLLEG